MCTSLSAVALAKVGPRFSLNGSHRRCFGPQANNTSYFRAGPKLWQLYTQYG